MKRYDAIVVGSGAMGSSIANQLAARGVRTLVLEKFTLNHPYGSSHGRTRIIRTAYAEHPSYVPMVRRAFELWRELETRSGRRLLVMTGGLMIGRPGTWLVKGTLRSAKEHRLPHSVLSPREVAERFPPFKLGEHEVAVHEDEAGFLFAEECIQAMKDGAEEEGAEFRFGESVTGWDSRGDSVSVRTSKGSYSAGKIVLAAGAWLPYLVPELRLPLTCERQTVFWFKPKRDAEAFSPERMPVYVWELARRGIFYGIPDNGDGVKAAQTHGGTLTTPENVERRVTPRDQKPVRDFLKEHLPSAEGKVLSSTTCIYTDTPDSDFIIDFHPKDRKVLIVSACSGHGFKFASVIGEIVSDLTLEGKTRRNVSFLRVSRFGRQRLEEDGKPVLASDC